MTTSTKTAHVQAYLDGAAKAHAAWISQIEKANKSIVNVSPLRANGIRKGIMDSNMRYTELVRLASDWAWGRYKAGHKVAAVSPRVPQNRAIALLQDIESSQDATWLSMLNLSSDKVPALRNTLNGANDYNADWLVAHDTRWAVDILKTVVSRMEAAGLF